MYFNNKLFYRKGIAILRLNKQLITGRMSSFVGQQITFKVQALPVASYVTLSKLLSYSEP